MLKSACKVLAICIVILQIVHEFKLWAQKRSERAVHCLTCSVQLLQTLAAPEMFTVCTRGVSSKACTSSRNHHHHRRRRRRRHRLYSTEWALASSNKCRQRPLSWTSALQFLQSNFYNPISTIQFLQSSFYNPVSTIQFLQSSFFASSSAPTIHLDFCRPRPR